MQRKRLIAGLAAIALLVSSVAFYSCQRSKDAVISPNEVSSSLEASELFFDNSPGLHTSVIAVQNLLKRAEDQKPFLNEFVLRNGYPSWSGSLIAVKNGNLKTGRSAKGPGDNEREILYVPFSDPNKSTLTTSILRVVIDGSDTTLKMLYPQAYKRLGFAQASAEKWNAQSLFSLFAMFDKEVFGVEKHIVKDGRIFGKDKSQALIAQSSYSQNNDGGGASGRMVSYTQCSSVTSCVYASENPVPALDEPNCTTTTTCTTYYFDDGYDPYGSGGGSDPGSGGGGSGTNPGPINEDPCDGGGGGGSVERLPEEGGGGGGDTPCDPQPWEEPVNDPDVICPSNFNFVSVTTNNLWQEALITDIHLTVHHTEFPTRYISVPKMYFGVAYYSPDGPLVYSKNEAKDMAAIAFDKAEVDVRRKASQSPTMTSGALGDYWIERANYWIRQVTLNRGSVSKTGSINPANTVPPKPYEPKFICL